MAPLLPISVCVAARDAERSIGDLARSVGFASEIVLVIDDRTVDRTQEEAAAALAPGQTLACERRAWEGHVAQKAYALSLARQAWVLCLDADERLSDALAAEIRALFAAGSAPRLPGYTLPRRTRFLGRWIRHGGWYPDRKLRLFRRERGRYAGDDPHDRIVVDGDIGALAADILHEGSATLREHLEKMDDYMTIAARALHRRGRRWPLAGILVHAPAKLVKMAVLRGGVLDGAAGIVLAGLGAWYVALKYAKLWEMLDDERRDREHGAAPPRKP